MQSRLYVRRIRKVAAAGLVVGACAAFSAECIAAGGETPSAAIVERPEAQAPRVRVGQEAPDFTLQAPDGSRHRLSDLRGQRVVVLIFFRGVW